VNHQSDGPVASKLQRPSVLSVRKLQHPSGKLSLLFSCLSGFLKDKKDKKVLKEQKSCDKKLQKSKVKVQKVQKKTKLQSQSSKVFPDACMLADSPAHFIFISASQAVVRAIKFAFSDLDGKDIVDSVCTEGAADKVKHRHGGWVCIKLGPT
jgi:hypothetical protein